MPRIRPGSYGNLLNPKGPNMTANKFIVAIVAALGIAGTVSVDGNISFHDAVLIAEAFFGSLGVYAVANTTKPT